MHFPGAALGVLLYCIRAEGPGPTMIGPVVPFSLGSRKYSRLRRLQHLFCCARFRMRLLVFGYI